MASTKARSAATRSDPGQATGESWQSGGRCCSAAHGPAAISSAPTSRLTFSGPIAASGAIGSTTEPVQGRPRLERNNGRGSNFAGAPVALGRPGRRQGSPAPRGVGVTGTTGRAPQRASLGWLAAGCPRAHRGSRAGGWLGRGGAAAAAFRNRGGAGAGAGSLGLADPAGAAARRRSGSTGTFMATWSELQMARRRYETARADRRGEIDQGGEQKNGHGKEIAPISSAAWPAEVLRHRGFRPFHRFLPPGLVDVWQGWSRFRFRHLDQAAVSGRWYMRTRLSGFTSAGSPRTRESSTRWQPATSANWMSESRHTFSKPATRSAGRVLSR